MLAYTARRLLALIPTLLGLLVFVFILGRALPGDPATTMAGPEATEEEVRIIREAWGLDEPLHVQFARYVANVTRGDFGRSLQTGRPVLQEIADRLPNSLLLTSVAMVIALVLGTAVGIVSAARPYSLVDTVSMVAALLLLSTPVFWLALMLIIVFAVELSWLPVFGAASWVHLILPATSLAAATTGMIARFARSSMLEVLGEDYIRTAWAKGASEWSVLFKHALRVALISIITVTGIQFGVLLGGSVLTETIFSWPGLGKFIYDAILARDYPALQAATLVFALVVALLNLLVDLSYGLIDPRVRYDVRGGTVIAGRAAFWRIFAGSPTARAGLFIILAMTAVAVFAPLLAPHDPMLADLRMRNTGPSLAHWLGTDELGRDILSRIVFGARISLFAAAAAVILALVTGLVVGLVSGYVGRWVDMVVMRLVDILMSFPAFLLALVIAAALGTGLVNAIVAVGVARLPQFARLTRSSVMVSKELEYVRAAKAYGCSEWRIALRHILPNIIGPITVQATLVIATSILTITGLGFLGIGIDPQTPEWGAMLGSGFKYLRIAPHVAVVPGLFIMLAVLGFNWLGDGLRDALDPKMRKFVGGIQT